MKNTITAKAIANKLQDMGFNAKAQQIDKNGTKQDAIIIEAENTNIYPTIYTKDIIKESTSLEEACDTVLAMNEKYSFRESINVGDLLEDFFDIDTITIGFEKEYESKYLTRATEFEGIQQYLRMNKATGEDATACIRISKEIAERLNLDIDEVWTRAEENTIKQAKIENMFDMLAGFGLPVVDLPLEEQMYIVSNDNKCHGASGLLAKDKIKELAHKLGVDSFVVMPSSIHEIILKPFTENTPSLEKLTELVQEVNATQVEPHEVLSNQAYMLNVA